MRSRPIPETSIIFSARTPKARSRITLCQSGTFRVRQHLGVDQRNFLEQLHLEYSRSLPMCSIGTGKFFEILICERLRDNVQKASHLPIVADIGNVIAGSGYPGWFVRKGFRELPVRSDPATPSEEYSTPPANRETSTYVFD